ncbi:MAG: transposase [Bacteroidales bacterium]
MEHNGSGGSASGGGSRFDPVVVPKHQRMSARIEQAIITLYSRGMSTRDIEATVKEIYEVQLSLEGFISFLSYFPISVRTYWLNITSQ